MKYKEFKYYWKIQDKEMLIKMVKKRKYKHRQNPT